MILYVFALHNSAGTVNEAGPFVDLEFGVRICPEAVRAMLLRTWSQLYLFCLSVING